MCAFYTFTYFTAVNMCLSRSCISTEAYFLPLSLFFSLHFSLSPSRQFTCLINHLSLQGRFLPSERPSSEITHSSHNGACSYRLSTERPRTHICSRIPQTINNSLLMFKSHFSDKVSTIKRNKLRPAAAEGGRLSRSGDTGKSFFSEFFRGEQIPLS